MAKRLRILAGPNGCGKTSIYRELRDKFHWGIFVNADEIERSLRMGGEINLSVYGAFIISFLFNARALNTENANKGVV